MGTTPTRARANPHPRSPCRATRVTDPRSGASRRLRPPHCAAVVAFIGLGDRRRGAGSSPNPDGRRYRARATTTHSTRDDTRSYTFGTVGCRCEGKAFFPKRERAPARGVQRAAPHLLLTTDGWLHAPRPDQIAEAGCGTSTVTGGDRSAAFSPVVDVSIIEATFVMRRLFYPFLAPSVIDGKRSAGLTGSRTSGPSPPRVTSSGRRCRAAGSSASRPA